jgi:L-alanine-DL-glutamate epimerase-like enolase superfamily enzyme
MNFRLERISLPLKVNWKISRSETTLKINFIVHLETALGNFRSEVAPNTRYGETPDLIAAQFDKWLLGTDLNQISSIDSLTEVLDRTPLFHSLRFGLESAALSYLAKKNNQSLSTFLQLPAIVPIETAFSMPIIPVGEIKEYLENIKRFRFQKIKVDAETGEDMMREIAKYSKAGLIVDANEGWKDLDQYLQFESTLKGMNIALVEQPFPSCMTTEYKELKKRTSYQIMADESIEDVGDFSELAQQFHVVNIKLMKTGSLIKARNLILEAKQNNMKAMLGCMIETTIGISYGMLFGGLIEYADLDGCLLVKDEPFRLIKETEGILTLSS